MSDGRRVVVVRRKVPVVVVEKSHRPSKSERKAFADARRSEGKKFHNFWWDEELFSKFAEKCEYEGIKPNEYLWSMIQKDMGWVE